MAKQAKKPVHEVLLGELDRNSKRLVRYSEKSYGTELAMTGACLTLLMVILNNMIIPDEHRSEIVARIRQIASECIEISQLSEDIGELSDRIEAEGQVPNPETA